MEESSPTTKPLELNLNSHFILGSVSEDNSEDETSSLVKLDLLEEKERSLSPVSVCSDSLSDPGLSNVQDVLASHIRYVKTLLIKSSLRAFLTLFLLVLERLCVVTILSASFLPNSTEM